MKGVTSFVLTNAGISTTTLLEALYECTKRAKPRAVGKEQSWAPCRGMYGGDQREELGRKKKEKEYKGLRSDMMRPAWGYLRSSLWHMTARTQLVVQVRHSLFCKQCFIHLHPDISSPGTFHPNKAAICTMFSILLLSNP